jgi:hypothetical protein
MTGTFPGLWWPRGHQDERVAGVLTIDYDNLSLDVIGSFGRLDLLSAPRE